LILTNKILNKCKLCNEPLESTFANLGTQPICEKYLTVEEKYQKETFYPLHVYFCKKCLLVQLRESATPEEIFKNYAYFSSHSKGWLKHIEVYTNKIIKKFNLNSETKIVEIGSNDGYLLQYFLEKKIPVLGIEPAVNVAKEALKKGVPTLITFFNEETSKEILKKNGKADLIIGNNILAQVPDINGFVKGLKNLLKPTGIITIEFHHLLNLVKKNQFDTISHERFFYLSFFIVEKLFSNHRLKIFDVEEFSTHGGSLRIYACHTNDKSKFLTSSVQELKLKEISNGMKKVSTYISYGDKVKETKRDILNLFLNKKQKKKLIVGYGAHAEAHTLLNYCGISTDFLDYTVDRNPYKQGKFIAGVHIPIVNPEIISKSKPDYVVVLPWNIKMEIIKQMNYIKAWNGKFIVLIPEVKVYDSDGSEFSNSRKMRKT